MGTLANFVLAAVAADEYAIEAFDVNGDIWSETDNSKTAASRKTDDPERDSVMQILGDSWTLGDGKTLGDGYYLGDSDDGKGEGVYEDYTVTAGNVYAFSFLYKCGHSGAYMTIELYDQSNGLSINTTDVNDTSWTTYEERVTAPVGCTTIRVKLLQKSDDASSGPFLIDDVALNESAIIYDPEEYSRDPEIIGGFLQTLGGRRIRDQRCVHYRFRLWWEYLEKGAFDLLYSLLIDGGKLYLDDGEVPTLTESETVYENAEEDYVGVTGPSSTNKAFTDNGSALPSAEDDYDTTEYDTAAYQKIDADDASKHETASPTAGNYLYHRFDIDPDINSGDAQRLRVLVKASCNDASDQNNDGAVLYIWDDTDGTWVVIAQSSSSAITELTYTTAETEVAQRYLDSSDQRIKLLLRSQATRTTGKDLTLRTYYVELEVNEGLDLVVTLSHRAILTDSDVIHVKNTDSAVVLVNGFEYSIAADRESITIFGVYAHLDGNSQYFYRTDADFPESGITGANDFTIQAWIKPDTVSGNTTVASKWHATSDKRMYLLLKISDELRLVISSDGTEPSTAGNSVGMDLVANEWAFIAVVYDASEGTADFYKNGVFISQVTGLEESIADKDPDFKVGAYNTDDNLWDGGVAHVALFDDMRSAAEILASYSDPDLDLSGEGNIIAQWHFDEAAAATAIDNTQGDAGRDLTPYDGGDETFANCGRTLSGATGDEIEVKYDRYWEVAFDGMPEDLMNGVPSGDRVREVEVFLKTLSETPVS